MQGFDDDLMARLSREGVFPASQYRPRQRSPLASGILPIDDLLGGGLQFGQLTEWGMPFATGGRQVILHFIKSATRGIGLPAPLLCLWASSSKSQAVAYPPYWDAHGIDLSRVHFAFADHAVDQLKHFFMRPLFSLIILDDPERFSRNDVAFLARKAEQNSQLLLILRNFHLTNRLGNVWAKLRINCYQAPQPPYPFRIEVLRGRLAEARNFVLEEPRS